MNGPAAPDPDGGAESIVSPRRLSAHVEALEGERHPTASRAALEAAVAYCGEVLADLGLEPRRHAFDFRGETFENVVTTLPGAEPGADRVLVGAHVDTVRGTPGADDNASGVAGLLEVGRALRDWTPRAPVELAVFNLEERQGLTYRVGSRRWLARAEAGGVAYAGAFVFEMIGYRTREPGSQRLPSPVRWMDIPRTGDFLACLGDGRSRELVDTFVASARAAAPSLRVVSLTVPMRGWLLPAARRSDNASFWSRGWPALMLTDTADLRNPHYHRATDRRDTLDLDFTADVVAATVEAVRRLAG